MILRVLTLMIWLCRALCLAIQLWKQEPLGLLTNMLVSASGVPMLPDVWFLVTTARTKHHETQKVNCSGNKDEKSSSSLRCVFKLFRLFTPKHRFRNLQCFQGLCTFCETWIRVHILCWERGVLYLNSVSASQNLMFFAEFAFGKWIWYWLILHCADNWIRDIDADLWFCHCGIRKCGFQ